jgi:hypothetical protein
MEGFSAESALRNDILNGSGRHQRGWRGLGLRQDQLGRLGLGRISRPQVRLVLHLPDGLNLIILGTQGAFLMVTMRNGTSQSS